MALIEAAACLQYIVSTEKVLEGMLEQDTETKVCRHLSGNNIVCQSAVHAVV